MAKQNQTVWKPTGRADMTDYVEPVRGEKQEFFEEHAVSAPKAARKGGKKRRKKSPMEAILPMTGDSAATLVKKGIVIVCVLVILVCVIALLFTSGSGNEAHIAFPASELTIPMPREAAVITELSLLL